MVTDIQYSNSGISYLLSMDKEIDHQTCHHSTEAVSEPTHHQEKRDMTSRTLTGIGQVRTETDKEMNNLIIDYQTRTRTIF